MDFGIRGRNALVCGASKGLGRGCAAALAAEGVNVTLVARTAGPLDVIGAKFLRPVRPGDALRLRFSPAADNTVRFECVSEGQSAVSGVLRFDA